MSPEGAAPPETPAASSAEARLRSELALRETELEAQRRLCAQWVERFERAKRELAALEEKAGEFQREAAARAAWSRELEETLKVVDSARAELSAALDGRRQESAALRARAQALLLELDRKEAALEQSQQVYESATRSFAEESAGHQKECQRLLGEIERIAAEHARAQTRLQEERRKLDAEREGLIAEVAKAMESAEAVRREGIEAFEEALELKRGKPGAG